MIFDAFLLIFVIFDVFFAPGSEKVSKKGPKWTQNESLLLQKWVPGKAWILDAFLDRFWCQKGAKSDHFWARFGTLFGTFFGAFFGCVLGRFGVGPGWPAPN